MRVVTFTVFGAGQPKGSMKAIPVNGRAILTSDNPKLAGWEGLIRMEAGRKMEADPRLFEGPVHLSIAFYFARPKSVSARERPFPTVKPDLSKIFRGAEDALSGIVFRDDAQVVDAQVAKFYTDGPERAVLTITDCLPGGPHA